MQKGVAILFCTVCLLLLLGCVQIGEKETAEKAKPVSPAGKVPDSSAPRNDVIILDKSLLRNSQGVPVAVKIAADVREENLSCGLRYNNQVVEDPVLRTRGKITVIAPLLGRIHLQQWKLCCGEECA